MSLLRPFRRFLSLGTPFEWERCILVLEQLESREVLSPAVFSPGFEGYPQVAEGADRTFNSYSSTFFVQDEANVGQTYSAVLQADHGTLTFDNPGSVALVGNGTSTVTLTGTLNDINTALSGDYYDPNAGFRYNSGIFSGDADITLTVTDTTTGELGSDDISVQVLPLVSNVQFSVNASGEVFAPASGFSFGGNLITFSGWNDNDGSEELTVNISLNAPNGGFQLYLNGQVVEPVEPGITQWRVSANTPAALRELLDSLVLKPPSGYSGRAQLSINADIEDSASYPKSEGEPQNDFAFLGGGWVSLRFFQGGSMTLPPVFAQEGATIDLGGRFSATDPDEIPGDIHSLTISVASGTLALNAAAVPSGLSASIVTGPDGSTAIVLEGSLSAINTFLATPGCMSYTAASPTFSGAVPLNFVLKNRPVPFIPDEMPASFAEVSALEAPAAQTDAPGTFRGTVSMTFVPVASHVIPSATDATTNQDTPVPIAISLTDLADADGSESVLVVLSGVPDGASFNAGTNLGGGQWAFSAVDLAGLIFTPPPGATGAYTITAKAIVTDTASGLTSDVATESTTFTITVLTVPVDTPPPTPTDPTPTPVPNAIVLPPDDTEPTQFLADDDNTASGEIGDVVETEDNDIERNERPEQARVPFAGYTGMANDYGRGGSTLVGPRFAWSSGGSAFATSETSQSLYAGGEKHPLPPVLPLDQSIPVAGFSDSGGDSFLLIDQIYRGANEQIADGTVSISLTTDDPISESEQTNTVAVTAIAVTNNTNTDTNSGETPTEVREENWRLWAIAGTITSAVLAWFWLSRKTNWSPTQVLRRLARLFYRRTPERAA